MASGAYSPKENQGMRKSSFKDGIFFRCLPAPQKHRLEKLLLASLLLVEGSGEEQFAGVEVTRHF